MPRIECFALLLTAAPLAAQSVLQVPAVYPQISAAIAAAQPGDVVEVAAGTYAPFTCTKAITITSQPGAIVTVASMALPVLQTVGFAPPNGSLAKVHGIRFLNPFFVLRMQVEVTGGRVAFENCEFESDQYATGALRVTNAAVWLRNCSCSGLTPTSSPLSLHGTSGPCAGLHAINSFVAAVDSTFVGGTLLPDGNFGAGDGILATGSSLHLVRCTATGGASGSFLCTYPNGHGLHVQNGATWLTDVTLIGGSHAGCAGGGDALHNAGTVPVHLTRGTTTPGVGTVSSGASVFGPTVPDTGIGLAAPTVDALLGSPYRIDYRTQPNALLLLFVGDALAPAAPVVTVEPTWLASPSSYVAFVLGDAGGVATFQTTIPNVPALRYTTLWLHAAEWPGAPLHVAPPLGGLLR